MKQAESSQSGKNTQRWVVFLPDGGGGGGGGLRTELISLFWLTESIHFSSLISDLELTFALYEQGCQLFCASLGSARFCKRFCFVLFPLPPLMDEDGLVPGG